MRAPWFNFRALSVTSRRASVIDALNPCSARTRPKATSASTPIAPTLRGSQTFAPPLTPLKFWGRRRLRGRIGQRWRRYRRRRPREIAASLKDALGGAITVGALADKTANPTSGANAQSRLGARDVEDRLRRERCGRDAKRRKHQLPERRSADSHFGRSFLERAAGDLKQLPAGSDRDRGLHRQYGDADANLALSQKRAEAVRNLLIKAGVNPETLSPRATAAPIPSPTTIPRKVDPETAVSSITW